MATPVLVYQRMLQRARRPAEYLLTGGRGRKRIPVRGEADFSERLRDFIDLAPLERRPIADFVARAAAATPNGSRVFDAGSGDAPYAELFSHCEYVTSDWAGSPHAGSAAADVIAPLDDLPVADESFDAVLNTQVLEHLPDPAAALRELRRILVPGGRLWLTAPFVWYLHEEPHDYFRYTGHGLRSLLERAGFVDVRIEPRGGYFTTMATLAGSCGALIGHARDRRILRRLWVSLRMWALSLRLERLDSLDVRGALPLGYQCTAGKPGGARR
jgi:SAM-dependent methyltransferase